MALQSFDCKEPCPPPPDHAPARARAGEPLVRRKDDNADTLKARLAAFHSQTAPVRRRRRARAWGGVEGARAWRCNLAAQVGGRSGYNSASRAHRSQLIDFYKARVATIDAAKPQEEVAKQIHKVMSK